MKFSGLLFDLDGTILDTTNLIVQSFQHTFRVHYNRQILPQEVHRFFGKPLRTAMEALGPDKVEELIETYREYNLTHHDALTTIFSGMRDTLETLYDAGFPMAIVTSKTSETALRGLKLFNMDHFFPVLIGVHECERHKPNREPVETALRQLGLSAETCLMIGDSPFDIISARDAGAKTAAVRWTYVSWEELLNERPTYILEKPQDLLSLCGLENINILGR